MWNIVVISHLLSEKGLATAWGTCDEDFDRLELSLFGELVLHKLDVLSHTGFTVPVEL